MHVCYIVWWDIVGHRILKQKSLAVTAFLSVFRPTCRHIDTLGWMDGFTDMQTH